jgi:hypothetical protein
LQPEANLVRLNRDAHGFGCGQRVCSGAKHKHKQHGQGAKAAAVLRGVFPGRIHQWSAGDGACGPRLFLSEDDVAEQALRVSKRT